MSVAKAARSAKGRSTKSEIQIEAASVVQKPSPQGRACPKCNKWLATPFQQSIHQITGECQSQQRENHDVRQSDSIEATSEEHTTNHALKEIQCDTTLLKASSTRVQSSSPSTRVQSSSPSPLSPSGLHCPKCNKWLATPFQHIVHMQECNAIAQNTSINTKSAL